MRDENGKYVGPLNPTHGKASTYRNSTYKCRCRPCCEAHSKKHYEENEARRLRLLEDPTLAPHGSVSTYRNWGCRCTPCTVSHSEACANYYAARVKAKKEAEAA